MRHDLGEIEVDEPKVCEEQAIAEFKAFCRANRIKLSVIADDDERSECADGVIDAVMDGRLTFDSTQQAHLSCEGRDKPLVFKRLKGEVQMATDMRDKLVAQTYASLAAWTGESPALFPSLDHQDIQTCGDLLNLFFLR